MADYTLQWLEYKRLRKELVLFLLTAVPLFFLLALMSVRPDHYLFWAVFGQILNVAWLVGLVIMYLRLRTWPCPRCGQHFYSHCERQGLWLLTKHCWHCQLQKFCNENTEDLAASDR